MVAGITNSYQSLNTTFPLKPCYRSQALKLHMRVRGPDNRQNFFKRLIVNQAEQVGLFTFKAKFDEPDGKLRPFNEWDFLGGRLDYSPETCQLNASFVPHLDPIGDGNREVTHMDQDKRNHE